MQFFVSSPIGFENKLAAEIKNFWFEMIDLDGQPTRSLCPELDVDFGGISLETELHLGFQINLFSKLANRVLLRINRFEARYFDQFEKSLSKIEFKKYLAVDKLAVKIESQKSRLNNEKSLLEAVANVFKKQNITIDSDSDLAVYIRIEKDRVQVSLDTTGEHLHKRGYGKYKGEAPIRETLAAFLVSELESQTLLNNELNIIDPFVGSGTLLFEASSSKLPNLGRSYSFLKFQNAPKLFKSETWVKNYKHLQLNNKPICYGFDIDEKSIQNANKNLEEYKKIFNGAEVNLNLKVQDSSTLDLSSIVGAKWIIANPPYGIRLSDDNAKNILEKLFSQVEGIIFIYPQQWNVNFKKINLIKTLDFQNQGLKLKFSVWRK